MKFNHAIVLGCGFAGTLAAHLLAQYFTRVSVIEKDDVHSANRNGLPQAMHLHVLMQRGQQLLEQLMPGIFLELLNLAQLEMDWSEHTKWYGPFGPYPQYPSEVKTLTFSRSWLDKAMLQRLFHLNNITFFKGRVINLRKNDTRIDGVEWINHYDQPHYLEADLIIDARGRSTNISDILNQLNFSVLPPRVISNELGYASRIYQIQHKNTLNFNQIYIQVRPGKINKGVVISPIENQRMMVTALGFGIDKPQRDENQFEQFLSELAFNELHDFLSTLQPISPVHIYRNLKNCDYRFGQMKKWPSGLIVIGDAACILNPVYGQGMTLAAKQIMLLKKQLDQLQNTDEPAWEHRFQKKLSRLTTLPWLMATTEDQRAGDTASLPINMRCLQGYFDRILKLATKQREVHHLFIKILHMMESPLKLFYPRILLQLFFSAFKRES